MADPRPPSDAAADAPARMRRRRLLGDLLVDNGVITSAQLADAAERLKKEKGAHLGRLLLDLGYATEVQICEVLAEQLQIPAADLVAVDVPPEVLGRVPKELATKYVCLPWFIDGRDLYLIMADPTNLAAADAVAFHAGLKVKPVVAPESEILLALQRLYSADESSLAQFENIDLGELSVVADLSEKEVPGDEDLEKAAQSAPVVKLVNAIMADAIRASASDIHIEPQEKNVNVRYRVDGLLRQVTSLPRRIQTTITSRIKIMAHMDIAERRKPQDGRTRLIVGGKPYDMRVSTLPTADGEKVVIRILVQERASVALEELGFEPDVLAAFKDLLKRPQGMILVTGPTGSGKTSTLYAALNFLRGESTNIVTVEDPVEYRLPGVNQVAVSERLSFAAGLRSILRQDPNVVMVGEIRDAETAQIAFQAAQTGHLVLSTLHTNDAPSAATRLVEMGVPAYVVASSVIAVQAQRLVRRLCACKRVLPDGTAQPGGCDACRQSGFKGRTAIYELMRLTPRVRSVLLAGGPDDLVRRAARASGMRTMYMDGALKAARGVTIIEEVLRVVPADEDESDALESQGDAAPTPRVPAALSQEVRKIRRHKILLAEDDASLRETLRELLVAEEYDVVTAADGREARALVYREAPDLVLTDIAMPHMDGLELLERIRADLATRDIPVVFITGLEGGVNAQIQAYDLGADGFVTKPIQHKLMLSSIRRSLFRAHLLRSS